MLEEYKLDRKNWNLFSDTINIRSDVLITEHIVDFANNPKDLEILELGSGNGKVARKFSRLGNKVVGVDVIKEQIDVAKSLGEKVEYIRADFSSSDFVNRFSSSKKFDIVLSLFSLMYLSIEQLESTLENINKLLITDGKLIVATIHPCREILRNNFDYFKIQELQNEMPSRATGLFKTTYTHFPLEILFDFFLKAGFKIHRILEPRATANEVAKFTDILSDNDKYIPNYLLINLKK